MSTQDAEFSVPLVYSYDQAPVRLLELPPSLVSLIENATTTKEDDKPILKIKAPSAAGATPNAYLCTSDETYMIRHVHTSNSIFLLRPHLVEPEEEDEDALPKPGVAITSTCGSYLELIPQKSTADAAAQLRSLLPDYPGVEYIPATKPEEGLSREEVGQLIAVSDAEFKALWEQVGAFDVYDDWAMKLPPTAALGVLKELVRGSMEAGLKIWKGDGVGMPDIVGATDPDEGWPEEAAKTVIRAVAEKIVGEDGSITWRFDPKKTCTWVGRQLLQQHNGKKLTTSEFTDLWTKSLPDECTDEVDVALIKPYYNPKESGSIQITDLVPAGATTAAAPAAAKASEPKTAAKASARKWHDRFQRPAKK